MATTITYDSLTTPTGLQTTPPTQDSTNYQGIIDNALSNLNDYQSAVDTAHSNDTNLVNKITQDNNTLLNKTSDTAALNESLGVNSANADITKYTTQLADVTANIKALGNEAKAIPLDVQNKAANTGATDAGVAPIQTGRLRENAIKALTQSSIADVLTANITGSQIKLQAAKDKVQQAIDLKYKPIEDEINNLQTQLALNKTYITDPAEKKLADAQQKVLDERARLLANEKEKDTQIQNVVLEAAKNNAPQSIIQNIQNAKSPQEAIAAATGWLQDPLDVAYKKAQIAKIQNDIATSGTNALDPAGVLAYAQQYASNGQIPTGLPKGTFGMVSQVAKELPKPTGTLVDMNTGVKSGKITAETQTGVAALYDILNNDIPKLRQKFNQINTGVVGGTLGNLFGSQDRQDFKTYKQEILSKLALARSGKAVTDAEYGRFLKLLPTSFNQPFFLGTDGEKKINSLEQSLTGSLNSTLSTNGLSIYGYSTVNIGGNNYKVGDIVQNSQGQSGRINPDGSITYITQ